MNFIITLLILLLILGILIAIHEFGHFLVAKKRGVFVHEFCIGMGPKICQFKRKNDETEYTIRLLPIGGFVALASSVEKSKKIKKEQILENKKTSEKLAVLFAGIIMNIVLAFIILFISGLIFGSPETKPVVGGVVKGYPAEKSGIEKNDLVLSINNKDIKSWDDIVLELNVKDVKDVYVFKVQKADGKIVNIAIKPKKEEKDGEVSYAFGITSSTNKEYGIIAAFEYTINKTVNMIDSIANILQKLFTGKVEMNKLSGPVGMFEVVDNVKSNGIESILYLIAFLSINVAIINLIPIPVFDGGKILIVIIEKIKGSKVNPSVEEYLNAIGFLLLILLMIYVTYNDIVKLF